MRATIGYGYSNARDDVRAAQLAINVLGFGPIDTDGAFGPATRGAVVRLQRARSLDADGIVGPATWAALTATTATTMPTRASLIAAGGSGIGLEVALLALADVGAAEDPPRSNQGPEIAHLVDGYDAYWATGSTKRPPWCAIAVSSWIRIALGLGPWVCDGRARKLPGHPFDRWLGAVSQLQDWGRTRGLLLPSDAMVRPGMLALRERAGSGSDSSAHTDLIPTGSGHVDVVLMELDDGAVLCVGANLSDRVELVTRDRAGVRCFVDLQGRSDG